MAYVHLTGHLCVLHRVDLHIPNEDIVGGYSISSPPHQLAEDYSIELAIKHSDYPPTLWMTTKVSLKVVLFRV